MSSRDHRSNDNLDFLIRQALVDSVGDEEPPARVWDRISTRLSQPDRRPSIRWSGPVLQAVLLALLFLFGSISLWHERSAQQFTVVPSIASPTALQALPGNNVGGEETDAATIEVAETQLLREYSSLQTRSLIVEQLQRRTPGVAVSTADIPPHPNSPQAKALHLETLREAGPAELPVVASGEIWQ